MLSELKLFESATFDHEQVITHLHSLKISEFFYVTQILREINFGQARNSETAISSLLEL